MFVRIRAGAAHTPRVGHAGKCAESAIVCRAAERAAMDKPVHLFLLPRAVHLASLVWGGLEASERIALKAKETQQRNANGHA